MIFGRLTSRNSLQNLIVAIDTHRRKTYHIR